MNDESISLLVTYTASVWMDKFKIQLHAIEYKVCTCVDKLLLYCFDARANRDPNFFHFFSVHNLCALHENKYILLNSYLTEKICFIANAYSLYEHFIHNEWLI